MYWLLLFLCLKSKPPSRQQIYFQNQCFTMEKRWITTRVNWPLSWECWTIQLQIETTVAPRVRTNLNSGNISFLFCLTGKFGIWFFYGVTCPQQLHPDCASYAIHGGSTCLNSFSLVFATFFASLIIKSLFICYMQIFANGVCSRCRTVQLVEQCSKWPSSGCCLSRACIEHFICCIHTTLTSVEVQSCLERHVVLIMSPANLLEVHTF